MRMLRFLEKEQTIAKPDFNRWLVPPAALAIHLSIGMAYGFSVFWLPLSRSIGITAAAEGDWHITTLGWTYTLFFVVLGSSAAIFGGWLERNGPRKAGMVAACCWGGGFLVAALGVYWHQIWLLWLGSGVIGGCGLGLGYISPVSTLIKWFPDKRGMATGMAIMGFGGGAMIGAPLADKLMNFYATATSVGVWETFVPMGVIYFVAMTCGALTYRIPPHGWRPHGWKASISGTRSMVTQEHVHVNVVHRTPQFWLLWVVLCTNVSAGIGVIGMASPMLQEVFGGRLIGVPASLASLTPEQQIQVASIGAAFAGLLSLFNIAGRFFWASLSDYLGRKRTYCVFFVFGSLLYVAAAYAATTKLTGLFVVLFCVILTMYGGGFATIPAYLADLFGTQFVGAIHGRVLTAWSTAGILGPVLVNYTRDFQIQRGVPNEAAYNITLYLLAGLLFLGFLSNFLIGPVKKHHYMSQDLLEKEWRVAKHRTTVEAEVPVLESTRPSAGSWLAVAGGWTMVGLPLAWGIIKTTEKASAFFH